MNDYEIEILDNLTTKIEQINQDLGSECIRYMVMDPEYLHSLSKIENGIYQYDHNLTPEELVDMKDYYSEEYKDFIIENLFGGEFENFNIGPHDIRNIIYNSEDYKNSSASSILHRDFNKESEQGTWNIIGYENLYISSYTREKTYLEFLNKAGTGLVYLKEENGKQFCQHVILPAFEGLVLAIKDSYFYHYTPYIDLEYREFVNRTLIRNYVVDKRINPYDRLMGYEEDKHELLYQCANEKNFKRLLERENDDLIPLLRPRPDY